MKSEGRTALVALLIVVAIASLAGAVGFALGGSGGPDLDAARAAGRREAAVRGSVRGAQRGYDAGILAGRHIGFRRTYRRTYRSACRKAVASANTTIGPAEACR